MFIAENLLLQVIDKQLTRNESENKMCTSINKVFKSERKWEGKLTNFVKPNCIMQLANIVSVAKIKRINASTQHACSEPGIYDAAVNLPGDQWQCPF